MRSRDLIAWSMLGSLGLLACSGGGGGAAGRGGAEAGSGGGRAGAGLGGATAGAAGSISPSGTGGAVGTGGVAGATSSGGVAGATSSGGAAGATSSGGAGGVSSSGGSGGSGAASGGAGQAGAGGQGGTSGGGNAGGVSGAGGAAGAAGAAATGGAAGQTATTPPHSLNLLAGGLGGLGNVDGTGAAARFNYPMAVASDGAGNLFVADCGNSTIRKIVIASGAVTTFAGKANAAGSLDGVGADARFSCPYGIASDRAGTLFVGDNNRTIRKIVIASAAVTTLAGSTVGGGGLDGTGTSARFDGPSSLVYDAGNLFVADNFTSDAGNRTAVRKIVVATGVVTTIATLTSTYSEARGAIASDGAGNVYVAYNDTISKVVVATGAVTRLAGAPAQTGQTDGAGANARFYGPTGIVSDRAGNLYVSDTGNNRLRKVVIASGAVTTLVDPTGLAAYLDGPIGLDTDGSGNLFVATNDHTIRTVAIATSAVTTLAGAGRQVGAADGTGAAARFTEPYGIASDGAGNLFVADTYNNIIRQVVIATGAVTTLAGTAGQYGTDDGIGAAATFANPNSIASDGAGNVYVLDGIVRKVVVATGVVTTLTNGPGRGVGDPNPAGLTSDGAGSLYFVDSGTTIWKVVIATGELTAIAGTPGLRGSADGAGAAASFDAPNGLATDGTGNLYVADTQNYTIRKIVLRTQEVTTFAGQPGQQGTTDGAAADARFYYPLGVTADGAGNLFVTDGNTVRQIAVATAAVSTVIGAPAQIGVSLGPLPASLSGAFGIVVLPTGELALLDYFENAILIGHL